MYGLLLENVSEFIKAEYGEDKWEEIRHLAKVDMPAFSTHQVYSENIVPRLIKKAAQVLNKPDTELLFEMGRFFVSFVGQYGYDQMLSVLGRHFRDFINGLDNLHEYLKFSYPRMRPPSFFCEGESSTGMLLHYRSKRKGYAYYTMGQIKEVAHHFYNTDLKIEVLREDVELDTNHVVFTVQFDNKAFSDTYLMKRLQEEMQVPLKGSIIFEIFPFCIIFGNNMIVKHIGISLMQILPGLIGKKLTDWFDLLRPIVEFKFSTILRRTNNIFEIATSVEAQITRDTSENKGTDKLLMKDDGDDDDEDDENLQKILLKGQMLYMEDWKMVLFICTPVMPDLDCMIYSGLYINDLSMHDFSRDLMLAGTQQSVELKLALDQEQLKSKKLEESMRLLDEEMKRTDELLYQMIPKQVADRLRKGENPVDTCETFDSVSILFSDVVTFTEIASRLAPMEVVSLLNAMYSIFDNLTEKHNVYKVETIGDAYMVVAGAPERREKHGHMVANMALDMVEAISDLKDPSTGNAIRIRVGIHSGMVVAGVVGMKMPRYCLFGDSVNTASRMESTSESQKIHISETAVSSLSDDYVVTERGEIEVKGKGKMKTYWLVNCKGRVSCRGQFNLSTISTTNRTNNDRRGSDMSRTYSPVTFHDVVQRSLTSTPVPATPQVAIPPMVKQDVIVGSGTSNGPELVTKERERTFSNAVCEIRPGMNQVSPRSSVVAAIQATKRPVNVTAPEAEPLLSPSKMHPFITEATHPPQYFMPQQVYPPSQHHFIPGTQYYVNSNHGHLPQAVVYPQEILPMKPPPLQLYSEKVVVVERGSSPIQLTYNRKAVVQSRACSLL